MFEFKQRLKGKIKRKEEKRITKKQQLENIFLYINK